MTDRRQLDLFGGADPDPPKKPSRARPVEPAAIDAEDEETARRLPSAVRLGTSSWSFPGWRGTVWRDEVSERKLSRDGLPAYSRHPLFRCVGLDRTHYQPMTIEQYLAYAEQVPPDFRFMVKAHEASTIRRWPDHPRYGNNRGSANALFLDAAYAIDEVIGPTVAGLGERLGPILFQVAPQSLRGVGGAAGFVDKLHGFLAALPPGPTYAVEIRNRELLTAAYVDALGDVDGVHCLNVHDRMPQIDEQAVAARVDDQPALLVRWMLQEGLSYQDAVERYSPFDRIVDEDRSTRSTISEVVVRAHRAGKPVYVVVNNKAEGSSPHSVFALARKIAKELDQPDDPSIV